MRALLTQPAARLELSRSTSPLMPVQRYSHYWSLEQPACQLAQIAEIQTINGFSPVIELSVPATLCTTLAHCIPKWSDF